MKDRQAQPAADLAELRRIIAKHWGYSSLRPLQEQAMRAVLDGRDSLVVLPTGGGKSLCYQAPAVLNGGVTVVVSPLIALMKDQVDALRGNGVAAAQIDSSLSDGERFAAEIDFRDGAIRLLFVSPERLVTSDFYRLLQQVGVQTFAIDEAHCISHWGHDFRPEYRQLARLREHFPGASVHAYTATATEQVRRDIISQLALRDPVTLVGDFDRPNLTYRVLPRHDLMKQVAEVLERHDGEGGIIYCLRRRDVDELAAALQKRGVKAVPYHAGLSADQRRQAQEAFTQEGCDVVVATVAFGMGIDRSNVRFVLHTAMPKSLEHYQQEIGRAGRDGLEAECVLLYSGADVPSLKWMLEKSAQEAQADPEFLASALRHLDDMDRYARGAVCRHRALVDYFGQKLEAESCGACDLCLGDTAEVAGATTVAQKVLSCVARVKEGFGINHVVAVLRGDANENVRRRGHDQLTTFGLLKAETKADVRDWIYQLIGQKVLMQIGDDYPLLKLNEASWEVMRGKRDVRLIRLVRRKRGERVEKSSAERASQEGVDTALFGVLKQLRSQIALERGGKPYMVFSDAVLRDLARVRPSSPERMRMISGVGEVKLRDFAPRFLPVIAQHCGEFHVAMDVNIPVRPVEPATPRPTARMTARTQAAHDLYRKGASIDSVMRELEYSRGTAVEHLAEFIRTAKPASIATWVPDEVVQRVAAAARQLGVERMKPIYQALNEQVPYDDIRLVLAYL
ncbi:MAG TPA: DNA helicase RecQ [Gemmataceae bacterium]|nr:DNA helicase RecQ [Gemmataceae bacterium]